ncbi:hypothetical protein ARMGADRAFT_312611 [Armillaria gallica]|uniref:Uncharacterized protein n=1 Tax=Armillaria gallica TaxID=47427 RepID=A0A2H3DS70_ARMGA|nr:hypothetical protein ARMGADRAFT_312611 [Armillaria gallica]
MLNEKEQLLGPRVRQTLKGTSLAGGGLAILPFRNLLRDFIQPPSSRTWISIPCATSGSVSTFRQKVLWRVLAGHLRATLAKSVVATTTSLKRDGVFPCPSSKTTQPVLSSHGYNVLLSEYFHLGTETVTESTTLLSSELGFVARLLSVGEREVPSLRQEGMPCRHQNIYLPLRDYRPRKNAQRTRASVAVT